jgi:hypothetical protein
MVDGVLGNLNLPAGQLARIGAQTVNGRIGMYVFCIDGCQQDFHAAPFLSGCLFVSTRAFYSAIYSFMKQCYNAN